MRKDGWLRELLTSSSEEKGEVKEKKAMMEEKYTRFDYSSRWVREAAIPTQKCNAQVTTKAKLAKREEDSEREKNQGQEESCKQHPSTDEMLRILDLLDERAHAIGTDPRPGWGSSGGRTKQGRRF
jgi:hypothetical protein